MARKRKGAGTPPKSGQDEEEFALPKAPERLASPFKDSFGALKKQLAAQAASATPKKAPVSAPSVVMRSGAPARRSRATPEDDAQALSLAMHGVKPLESGRANRVAARTPPVATRTAELAPFAGDAEAEARQRLEQLVASGVSFKIERERDFLSGLRKDTDPRVLRELRRRTSAHATLDLHGATQPEARAAVTAFVRDAGKRGLSVVCIVHGKGNHSEGGLGVLRDVTVAALTETAAAPLVRAFVSAPEALGGSGALLVELTRR